MAVVIVKSTQITARDATPRTASAGRIQGANVQHARGEVVITSGNSTGSTYIACSIPSNAIPVSVRISAPDIGTTTTADVGLYRTTADGAAVVSAAFFKAAVVLNAGAIAKSEVVNGNVATLALNYQPIWQLLALAADPAVTYDVVLTLVGAADGTGTALVEVDFTK